VLRQGLAKVGFDADERAALQRVIERLQPGYERQLRALYSELTGEPGDALEAVTLSMEIIQKSTAADLRDAQHQVSRERAGLTAPPGDGSGTIVERFLRTGIAAGDAFERALAAELSPLRARELRRTWGRVRIGPSCTSDDSH
jgi:hypothetical protein